MGNIKIEPSIERFKEGSKIFTEWLGKEIKDENKRKKKLIEKLIPLLKKKIINMIVKSERGVYEVFKSKEIPLDERLLYSHLESLINDFDHNIQTMTEEDVPIVAKALNENPFKSYFIPGD